MKTAVLAHIIPLQVLIIILALLGGKLAIYLPLLARWLDRKPFNCRPCLTFHLAWIPMALFAYCQACLMALLMGTVVAWVLFAWIKQMDNKRIDS